MSTDGGSKVTWFGRVAERVAKVALLATTSSAVFCRYADKDNTVLVLAGIVIAVTAGKFALVDAARDDVAEAELDGPTTVTRTVIVYVVPVAAGSTVNITGIVTPMSAVGGSRVTWPDTVVEMVAKVALAERIVSAGLFKYDVKDMTVFWFAGIVIAVILGAALEVAVALAELDPMTVTRTVMV